MELHDSMNAVSGGRSDPKYGLYALVAAGFSIAAVAVEWFVWFRVGEMPHGYPDTRLDSVRLMAAVATCIIAALLIAAATLGIKGVLARRGRVMAALGIVLALGAFAFQLLSGTIILFCTFGC